MKKILVSSLAAFAAVAMLSGCQANKSESSNKAQITKSQAEVIKFTGVNDPKYVVKLSSTDEFNTAVLEDSKGHKINLKNAVTASGTRPSVTGVCALLVCTICSLSSFGL